jgi:hypothetical protein
LVAYKSVENEKRKWQYKNINESELNREASEEDPKA